MGLSGNLMTKVHGGANYLRTVVTDAVFESDPVLPERYFLDNKIWRNLGQSTRNTLICYNSRNQFFSHMRILGLEVFSSVCGSAINNYDFKIRI